VCDVEYP